MEEKKNVITYEGLRKYEEELENTKVLGENDDYTNDFRTVRIKITDKDNYEVRTVEKHTDLSVIILIILIVTVLKSFV